MRITGGKARGIPLQSPRGDATRPATDQLRESVFSSLAPYIQAARVVDLYAGTGAYGLEAMSRGAAEGLFVENSPAVVACLQKNIAAVAKSCGQADTHNWRILKAKVESLHQAHHLFDIVFVDPPYDIIETSIERLFKSNIAPISADNAIVCFEMPGNLKIDIPGWKEVRRLGKAGKDKPSAAIFEKMP